MQVASIPLATTLTRNHSLACTPGVCVVARGLMRDIPGKICQSHNVIWLRMSMYNNQSDVQQSVLRIDSGPAMQDLR